MREETLHLEWGATLCCDLGVGEAGATVTFLPGTYRIVTLYSDACEEYKKTWRALAATEVRDATELREERG